MEDEVKEQVKFYYLLQALQQQKEGETSNALLATVSIPLAPDANTFCSKTRKKLSQ